MTGRTSLRRRPAGIRVLAVGAALLLVGIASRSAAAQVQREAAVWLEALGTAISAAYDHGEEDRLYLNLGLSY